MKYKQENENKNDFECCILLIVCARSKKRSERKRSIITLTKIKTQNSLEEEQEVMERK